MIDVPDSIKAALQPVVLALAGIKNVNSILCFGSIAVGCSDRDSDVDLYVFCDPEIPLVTDRKEALRSLPGIGNVDLNYAVAGWPIQWLKEQDRFHANGRRFDVAYNTTTWVETVVDKVREGHSSIPELRHRPYSMLGLLERSIILHDPDLFLKGLVSRLYPYPARLKKDLIGRNLPVLVEGLEDLRDCARRGIGSTAFLFHLGRLNDALCTILFAINERYDPSHKRVEMDLAGLPLLPANFLDRYSAILRGPFDEAGRRRVVEGYGRLVDEANRLIAEQELKHRVT